MIKCIRRIALLLLFVGPLWLPLPSFAAPQSRSDDDIALQQRSIEQLERRAAKLAGKDGPNFNKGVYYSVIRQGLAILSSARSTTDRRSQRANLEAQIEALQANVDTDLDESREVQERLDQIMSQGALGTRIFGGHIANRGEFTPVVAITRIDKNVGCSGTVIATDENGGWVLTAAHCVCVLKLMPGEGGFAQILFGNPNINTNTETKFIDANGTRLYARDFCTNFRPQQQICDVDLAVLRFNGGPPQMPGFMPAQFPSENSANRSLTAGVEIVGYGDVDIADAGLTDGARMLRLDTVGSKQHALISYFGPCPSVLPACSYSAVRHGCIGGDREIILSDQGGNGIDTCAGDSGGPVFSTRDSDAKRRLIAVTSRAKDAHGTCGPGGIYVKVFSQDIISWLRDDLGIPIAVDH